MPTYLAAIILFGGLLISCGSEDEAPGSCSTAVQPADCRPQYEPTFANVYARTLQTRCAIGGGACHLAAGARGGLILEGIDVAYENLVTAGRVNPDTTECSVLIDRLDRPGQVGLMPPGNQLTSAERCAVTQWVRAGAQR